MTRRQVTGPWRGLGVVLAAAVLGGGQPAAAADYLAIDLNPSGFLNSHALGVSGGQQVGDGFGLATGGTHALLWSGSAASVIDLNPSGFAFS